MGDEFKERLSELEQRRQGGLPNPGRAPGEARGDGRRGPRRRALGGQRASLPGPAPERLEGLPGAVRTEGVLVVEQSVGDLTSTSDVSNLLRRIVSAAGSLDPDGSDELVRTLVESPERALFMDTETTGLGSNMVFMLGVMRVTGDDVVLSQVFARDYREEEELLRVWTDMLAGAGLLVTFNGKSFDMPVLRDRLGFHGIVPQDEPPHLDLLHHSRRRWKDVLPDCRLQTLEWKVCGRRRSGDIPGEEIPGVYHHFVRTGQIDDILTVFHHNALDLITLADIALALASPGGE